MFVCVTVFVGVDVTVFVGVTVGVFVGVCVLVGVGVGQKPEFDVLMLYETSWLRPDPLPK